MPYVIFNQIYIFCHPKSLIADFVSISTFLTVTHLPRQEKCHLQVNDQENQCLNGKLL